MASDDVCCSQRIIARIHTPSLSTNPAAPLFGLARLPTKRHTPLLSVLEVMTAARSQIVHRLVS